MKSIELKKGSTSFDGLRPAERDTPKPAAGQVLVRNRAASLNYRDLSIARGEYFTGPVNRDLIPLSDGAGEVEAAGEGVERFAVGDRVAATFSQVPPTSAASASRQPLGSPLDGMLAEYGVFHENGLVHVPDHLSFEEAATLPCAGVTAWVALMCCGEPVRPGHTVLVLGTGGVSSFGLLFAKAAGARLVVTSSSDEKLERARELGADVCINYDENPDWHEAVLDETGGADCVVEVGGAGTLGRSMQAVAPEGKVALIGVLAEADENPSPYPLLRKRASVHGIYVGAEPRQRRLFEDMNEAIETLDIRPVIDRVFDMDEASDAYAYQGSGEHFGKIVISI